jgi:hypothetical protein
MRRSVQKALLIVAIAGLAGCATTVQPPPKTGPTWLEQAPGFSVAAGVPILAHVVLPRGFRPVPQRPPMWLLRGAAIGVAGTQEGHTVVLGFQGAPLRESRVLVSDSGGGATAVRILDVAPSPDGTMLAAAASIGRGEHVEVTIRNLAGGDLSPRVVARFDGRWDAASVGWLDASTLAVAIQQHAVNIGKPETDTPPHGELHILNMKGRDLAKHRRLECSFTRLVWSPETNYAFIEGGDAPAAMLIERATAKCVALDLPAQIRFLGWAPAGGAFLYFAAMAGGTTGGGYGVFQYDVGTGASRLIAISSAGAAYVSTGEVAVVGNRGLTWRLLATRPDTGIATELALVNTTDSRAAAITSLTIETRAGLLVDAAIAYSPASEMLAAQIPVPAGSAISFVAISFDVKAKNAGYLTLTNDGAAAQTAWSPDGSELAIVRTTAEPPTLAVLAPPR